MAQKFLEQTMHYVSHTLSQSHALIMNKVFIIHAMQELTRRQQSHAVARIHGIHYESLYDFAVYWY